MSELNYESIDVILLDIEGTTTPISFVAEKLFPYSKEKLLTFLSENYEEEQTMKDIQELKELYTKEKGEQIEESATKEQILEIIEKFLQEMIDQNRKQTNLKSIQGRIWEKGYVAGEILGEVYEDASESIQKWTREQAKKVYIYSSGSVWAQKLLFRYSDKGDLTQFLSGYYDTNIGHKDQQESYEKILKDINCESEKVLFLTDRIVEAEAAQKAGLKTALSIREGTAPLPDNHAFSTLTSFTQITLQEPIKEQPEKNEELNNQILDNTEQKENPESQINPIQSQNASNMPQTQVTSEQKETNEDQQNGGTSTPSKEQLLQSSQNDQNDQNEVKQLLSQKKEIFGQEIRDTLRKQQFDELRQIN